MFKSYRSVILVWWRLDINNLTCSILMFTQLNLELYSLLSIIFSLRPSLECSTHACIYITYDNVFRSITHRQWIHRLRSGLRLSWTFMITYFFFFISLSITDYSYPILPQICFFQLPNVAKFHTLYRHDISY